jgi:hypothetical protein
MLQASSRLIEHTTVRFTLERALEHRHARWLRGAVACQCDRAEFHHHTTKGLVYSHPLVRYDVSANQALIHGLAEGAFLLRGLPSLEVLRLGPENYRVLERAIQANRLQIGPCSEPIIYRFESPYLALNQENYSVWQRSDPFARRRLLEGIVVGNLLSLSQAVGLHVAERLRAETELVAGDWHELKPGLMLLGFRGAIRVNFLVPDRWGIGKSSARGFGTLVREESSHG